MKRQILINHFRQELAELTSEVEMSVKARHFDINTICEDVFCDLFKVLYGFRNLRNLNIDEKKNFPGIDLADDKAKVAIQVTSDKTIRKIKSSLIKVIQHNLHRKYSKIIFYNLTRKQGSYSQDSINTTCQGKIEFNVNTDILDCTDLATRAANADQEDLERAVNILRDYTTGGKAESENRLQQYREWFCRTYTKENALVPFSCQLDGRAISSAEVVRLVSERGGGLLLQGPSGCGKSILAEAAGNAYNDLGGIAIIIQGKDFDGRIKDVLKPDATVLEVQSAKQLLDDARRLGRPILFVADGYNECAKALQERFTRALSAIADRYEADVLVTSQAAPARSELLEIKRVYVPPPTMETKLAIAEAGAGGRALAATDRSLLAVVSSGLEAKLVGEVGSPDTAGSSRYALFDALTRRRLDGAASDGIRVLSQVAAWLSERVAFSLSIRDFDRLMDDNSVSTELRELLTGKGLLTRRGDRVSFPHEMFLDIFTAEAVVRQAEGRPESILEALSKPRHATRKDLIIGAIDDDTMLECLLPRLEDDESARACLQGRCGRHAQARAEDYCRKLWRPLREEAANVRFEVGTNHMGDAGFVCASLTEWTRCDQVFIVLLPELIAGGQYLDEAMDIVRIMDSRIEEESSRLCRETGIEKSELQDRLFATGYAVSQHLANATGISKICADITSGVFRFRGGITEQPDEPGDIGIWQELMGQALSPGQLYLFLELCRYRNIIPASFIRREIESRWNAAPYHLRLALVESVLPVHADGDDAERVRLIKVIEYLENNNPFLSSSIIEALQKLGALDQDAEDHQPTVRESIRRCLSQPDDNVCQRIASGIYSSQFEHPFAHAYCEAVASLADSERKALLEMASRGMEETGFWLGPLLLDLASLGDPTVGESIERWTRPPVADNVFIPQQDIKVFVIAHIVMARLKYSLPNHQSVVETPSVRTLTACGALLYWHNREDVNEEERLKSCKPALETLTKQGEGTALDVLRWCNEVSTEGFNQLPGKRPVKHSIVALYPDATVAISRDALSDPSAQKGYFRFFKKERSLTLGITILGEYGNESDRSLLRQYASRNEYGSAAISALKKMEERVNARPE